MLLAEPDPVKAAPASESPAPALAPAGELVVVPVVGLAPAVAPAVAPAGTVTKKQDGLRPV